METEAEVSRLTWADLVVIGGYFISVLAVGLWSSRKSQRGNVSGYFLASRNLHWIPVGGSLFGSNIGSGHFIGLAGAGAASGIAAHGYEQGAIYGLILLGWLFVPVYMAAGVYTMPEYLTLRFGGRRIRMYLCCLALVLYIFTKIAADLYAGALFIQLALNKSSDGWLYVSVFLLLGVASVFTIVGGLTAVVWTDLIQIVIMVLGSLVLMFMSLSAVGGYRALIDQFPYALASVRAQDINNKTCRAPPDDFMSLLRPNDPSKSDYPWIGMTFGMAVIQVWYWCTDQVIVQRTLASRSIPHAKGGTIMAAYLKYLPLWIMVLPGMASRVLYPNRVACATPETCQAVCGSPRGCTNSAYAELVLNLLPSGLRGLMVAVMMAAVMSSLTSVFNSASTIFSLDIWQELRKRYLRRKNSAPPSETELVVVGRLFIVFMVVASVVWIPVIKNTGNSQLFDYINMIISFLAAPITAVYVLAIFWERTNEFGAFWGLMFGLVIGMIRFTAEFYYTVPPCGSSDPDLRPEFIKRVVGDVHYLHFCLFCCLSTMVVAAAVSLLTPPIPPQCLYRLTFWTRKDSRVRRPLDLEEDEEAVSPKKGTTESVNNSDLRTGSELQQESPEGQVPMWLRMVRLLCGVSQTEGASSGSQQEPQLTQEQLAAKAARFLHEPPFWRRLLNINAIICVVISTFVYGFYA